MVIGLTGGIGSGKTTVANFFAELGVNVIDADLIARELTRPGAPAHKPIIDHFGTDILTQNGELDRRKLRNIIFKNPAARFWLENTLHPLILQSIRERIAASPSPYCLVVIPLLAEAAAQIDFLDRVCVVDAPEVLRKEWAAKRDQVATADIERIITAQSARNQRLAMANDVILNDRDLNYLKEQVKKLHNQYLQLAAA
jgi:dephospho-CoA kinase